MRLLYLTLLVGAAAGLPVDEGAVDPDTLYALLGDGGGSITAEHTSASGSTSGSTSHSTEYVAAGAGKALQDIIEITVDQAGEYGLDCFDIGELNEGETVAIDSGASTSSSAAAGAGGVSTSSSGAAGGVSTSSSGAAGAGGASTSSSAAAGGGGASTSSSGAAGGAGGVSTSSSGAAGAGGASTSSSGAAGGHGGASTSSSGAAGGAGGASTSSSGAAGAGGVSTTSSGAAGAGASTSSSGAAGGAGGASTSSSGAAGAGGVSTSSSGAAGAEGASTSSSGAAGGAGGASTSSSGAAGAGGVSTSSSGAAGAGGASTSSSAAAGGGAATSSSAAAGGSATSTSSASTAVEEYDYEEYGFEEECSNEPGYEHCECVPYYQCRFCNVVTDGAGLLDVRFGPNKEGQESQKSHSKCGPPEHSILDVCCINPEKEYEKPVPVKEYEPQCGRRNPQGIQIELDGFKDSEAQFGEFPWMVAVLSEEDIGYEETINRYVCGGSLIHPQVIMTAAHCVAGKEDLQLKVRLGEWDTKRENEYYEHEDHPVDQVVVHEKYYNKALFNDVALLFLKDPVKLNEHIDTICLPHPGETYLGSQCVATGWGKDKFEGGAYQNILKQVDLYTVDHADCQKKLRKTRLGRYFRLHKSFTCAGGEEGVDTCRGDGGSPLVCPDPKNPGRYVQAGIVAWGIGCGEGGVPGVYASVPTLVNWVHLKLYEILGIPIPAYTTPAPPAGGY